MKLDRTTTPVIKPIEEISIPQINSRILSNGIPLHYLNQGNVEVSRIDLMIRAGKWNQPKPLVSSFTSQLLKEGAGGLTGKEIAEQLDYYGAWLQVSDGYHYSYITAYTLNKYFKETLDILMKMFSEPVFSDEAFDNIRNRRRQQFLIDNEKVQYLANQGFSKMLFGESHPYGKYAILGDFDHVDTCDLKQFHQSYYRLENLQIMLSGKVSEKTIRDCDEICGCRLREAAFCAGHDSACLPEIEASQDRRLFIKKEGALQNGICMGLHVVSRSHPDFPGLRVLNAILGGYFGSRLMANIREDKGYTYGISSGIVSLKHAAYLTIATQTAFEHTEPLIREVYHEIDRLQNDLVSGEELEMVRNYMLGDFVRSLDGTFSLADAYLSLLSTGMDTQFLYKQAEAVKRITPDEIKELAQRYLNKSTIVEVVAGK